MLGEKEAKKNLGLAGFTGTTLFCMDIDPLLDLIGLAASQLFSRERGAQTPQDIAYQVRVSFSSFIQEFALSSST